MQSLAKYSCEQFSDALASRAAVPGGGGAAALIGALGAALCSMAGNLTLGKKKYEQFEPDIKFIISKAEILRARFIELIDEDAAAFEPLSKAYSLPKDTEGYQTIMHNATMDACRAPFEMVKCSCKAIELLEELQHKCSRLMISDVGCSAVAAKAALEAAAMNVYVNTRTLRNYAPAIAMHKETTKLVLEYSARAEAVISRISRELRG